MIYVKVTHGRLKDQEAEGTVARVETGMLIPATETNKRMLGRKLDEIFPQGKSDFNVVVTARNMFRKDVAAAYENDGKGCNAIETLNKYCTCCHQNDSFSF